MVIIVEGIDRVGKTTLCEKLSKEIGYSIFKKDRTEVPNLFRKDGTNIPIRIQKNSSAFINYGNAAAIVELINRGYIDNIIIDRFHWTEAVYSKIDRRDPLPSMLMDNIENQMQKERFLMVYVIPTDIQWSSNQHGTDLSYHSKMFDDLYRNSKLDIIVTDFNNLDKTVKTIKGVVY